MVSATLTQLDVWYNEESAQGGDRPQLLSKLATLELCGWIEGEFDRLVTRAEGERLTDKKWLQANVLKRTNGFHYSKHLRRMFCGVFGELLVQRIEEEMERQFPGDLDRLKIVLEDLWDKRCTFAHEDYVVNVQKQKAFDAPSMTLVQLKSIIILIGNFEAALIRVVKDI